MNFELLNWNSPGQHLTFYSTGFHSNSSIILLMEVLLYHSSVEIKAHASTFPLGMLKCQYIYSKTVMILVVIIGYQMGVVIIGDSTLHLALLVQS